MTMARSLFRFSALITIAALGIGQHAAAQDLVPADALGAAVSPMPDESPGSETTSDIQQWIKQLDSPKFSERQEARRLLSAAGPDALPALENAAMSDCS